MVRDEGRSETAANRHLERESDGDEDRAILERERLDENGVVRSVFLFATKLGQRLL